MPADIITVVPNEHGGRLKYYRDTGADERYWDELSSAHGSIDYSRVKVPWFLRGPLRRWVRPGGRLLEAGCGLATFTVAAHRLGYGAEGLDYAPQVVKGLQQAFPEIPFSVGDVRALEAPDDTYDAVYSPGVCEHFEEGPEQILGEMLRVLKPGGVALISTPCFNRFRQMLARRGRFAQPASGEFYQYAFSVDEMTVILKGLGYEVVEVSQHGALATLQQHLPAVARVPLGPLGTPAAVALDLLPVSRHWGHCCVWVARKSS